MMNVDPNDTGRSYAAGTQREISPREAKVLDRILKDVKNAGETPVKKPLNHAALGPLYEACKGLLSEHACRNGCPNLTCVAGKARSALTLAEQPGEAKDVQRWQLVNERDERKMQLTTTGQYVLFTDYAILSAQVAAMREVLAEVVKAIAEYKHVMEWEVPVKREIAAKDGLSAALARAAAITKA